MAETIEGLPTCYICGSSSVSTVARPDPWVYLRCASCTALFVGPMPEGDAVSNAACLYDGCYYSADARDEEAAWTAAGEWAADYRLQLLERELGRPGRILDVGCGTGTVLGVGARRGWQVAGVEISPSAAAAARANYGVDVTVGTLQSANFPTASFDVVWLQHVLEHVPNPIALLQEIKRVLRPGGVLVVAVPNSAGLIYNGYNLIHRLRRRLGKDKFSCSLSPPGHLYALNAKSLHAALSRVGLRMEFSVTSGKGDPAHFPVKSWKGAGRWPFAIAALERFGRSIGRGSILLCYARSDRSFASAGRVETSLREVQIQSDLVATG